MDSMLNTKRLNTLLGDHGNIGEVLSFSSAPLTHGGNRSETMRLHLSYAQDGEGPQTLVAKLPRALPPNARLSDWARAKYFREVRFYDAVGADVGLPTPQIFGSWENRTEGRFILLMEDLGECRRGPFTETDVRHVMEAFAGFHANWCNRVALSEMPFLVRYDEGPTLFYKRVGEAVPQFLDTYGTFLTEPLRTLTHQLCERVQALVAALNEGPQTLLHGDPKFENIALPEDGGPYFVDWQNAGFGSPTMDLSEFLLSLLMTGHTLNVEAELKAYHQRFMKLSRDQLPFDKFLRIYRQATLWQWLKSVIEMSGVPPEVGHKVLVPCFAVANDLLNQPWAHELVAEL